jgi:hypothetical protein
MISVYDDIRIDVASADFATYGVKEKMVDRRLTTFNLLRECHTALDRALVPRGDHLDDYCVVANLGYRHEEMTDNNEWAVVVSEWDASRDKRNKHQIQTIIKKHSQPDSSGKINYTDYAQVMFELSRNSKVADSIDADSSISRQFVSFILEEEKEDTLLRLMFAGWSLNHSGQVRAKRFFFYCFS